ncbi:MAG: molybdenum cofactor biosynthesis protein [Nitriliruptoraceae bacterium]
MRIRVYGGLTEQVGGRELEVELPEDGEVTVAELRAAIASAHPQLAPLLSHVTVAVDLEVARGDQVVPPDAEVALLPPVAGGSAHGEDQPGPAVLTGLVTPPIDVEGAIARIGHPAAGATTLFLGTVRDHAPGLAGVIQLQYSAYEPMAERELAAIAAETLAATPELTGIALLHALGDLAVGDHTILVACSSPHREAAYQASRAALEAVKARVPVFKRELTTDGTARWVGLPPETDDQEL